MRNLISTVGKAIILGTFLIGTLLFSVVAGDLKSRINKGADDVAILGYDPVAYFTQSRPVKGSSEFSYQWQDATWHFASAKHRDLFAADPEKYAPQFGGHCAMALTENVIKVVDPEAWTISDGKLYLTFSQKGRVKFRKDIPGNIKKSEGNWAKRLKKE